MTAPKGPMTTPFNLTVMLVRKIIVEVAALVVMAVVVADVDEFEGEPIELVG